MLRTIPSSLRRRGHDASVKNEKVQGVDTAMQIQSQRSETRVAQTSADSESHSIFGFLLGATASGSALYYYVIEEYKVSNELLTEDIYVSCPPTSLMFLSLLLFSHDILPCRLHHSIMASC